MKKHFLLFNILSTLFWLSFLSKTDSFFEVYALVAVLNIFFVCKKKTNYHKYYLIISIVLAICAAISNYNILDNLSLPIGGLDTLLNIFKTIIFIVLMLSGTYVFYGVVSGLDSYLNKLKLFTYNDLKMKKKVFLCTFGIMFILYTLILTLGMYPGVLTPDSLWQVKMGLTNEYNSVHPLLHTFIIKLIINLFSDLSLGVYVCSIVQILFISLCSSYMFVTLYEIGLKKKYLIISYVIFLLIPYNIIYSFTIWKDVVFGGFVILFITSLFREIYKLGNNLIVIFISGMGFCLFRSNGLYAFIVFVLLFVILHYKEYKKITICLVLSMFISIGFNIFTSNHFEGASISESLSIPLQQFARTVVDEDLDNDELKLINKYLDVSKIEDNYLSYISDPIKNMMNVDDFKLSTFIVDWLKIGIKHPISYIKGWVDQTRGYYNSGYDYGWFSEKIASNDLGLETTFFIKPLYLLFMGYLWLFCGDIPVLPIIRCLGLYTWALLILFTLAKKSKRKISIIYLPLLLLIATLLIASPVFCEFRYMYCVIACMPIIIFGYLYDRRNA